MLEPLQFDCILGKYGTLAQTLLHYSCEMASNPVTHCFKLVAGNDKCKSPWTHLFKPLVGNAKYFRCKLATGKYRTYDSADALNQIVAFSEYFHIYFCDQSSSVDKLLRYRSLIFQIIILIP